ncbi:MULTISPECIES: hypothetical protein [unclassified Gordonia (in: high G+C Gram-positive bacteria)]|uniref:hypothetical protein n=1 Tax=unclassified Gordonia (in: high G+C Gram-positive bacteria) TaxID=2657482 RepID=UPI001F109CF6|nr:hypothetical protein [Gordonia sp. ABSL49_1]MCH5644549.1 hypothetical protein [Gordonia sp. ABSL49_1]
MTYHQYQRNAQNFASILTIVGAIILMVCVGALTYTWWRDGRWLWVALGIAIIVVNIALIYLQFRRRKLTPPVVEGKKPRRGLIDPLDDLDD